MSAELDRGPDDLAALFCDLDGFKPVNDRLGHAAGDQLLVAVADRFRGCLREGDLVSRLGGDEFVIICRGADAVEVISDRIRAMVARPFEAGGEQVLIGVSLGVAPRPSRRLHRRPGRPGRPGDVRGQAGQAGRRPEPGHGLGAPSPRRRRSRRRGRGPAPSRRAPAGPGPGCGPARSGRTPRAAGPCPGRGG